MLKNDARKTVLLSAVIGLVLASLSTVPAVYASDVSKISSLGFAGYAGGFSVGEIKAEWNQPAITCQPGLAQAQLEETLLGIEDAAQEFSIGTTAVCPQASSTPQYQAIVQSTFFLIGPAPTQILLSLTVSPGDVFSASITFSPPSPFTSQVTETLTDLSTSQSASQTQTSAFPGASGRFAFWGVASSMFENPSVANTLSQFSEPIRFSHCNATVSGNTFTISKFETVDRLTLVDGSGNTMATTSSLSKAGSSFKVTWVSST